jgi:ribonuclease J
MSSLELNIHRGSHQIGGTCIELRCGQSRIVLDCGLPLVGLEGEKEKATSQARPLSVPGLFGDGPSVDGILLSHAHPDHSGMIRETNPSIPVYASRLTFKMAMAASIFANQPAVPTARERALELGVTARVGPFDVTALSVDHSIPGACAFLIEAAGKRVLYTGDLRFHGRKPRMRRALVAEARNRRIDLVLTEGTSLSRSQEEKAASEDELEEEGVALVRDRQGLVAAHFSPLNLDRLVSFLRISKRTDRTFLVDPYGAYVLTLARGDGIKVPDPCQSEGIRILMTDGFWQTRAGRAIRAHKARMQSRSIRIAEVLDHPSRFLMLWRPSMLGRLFKASLPPGTLCLRSLWKGYLETDEERQLAAEFAQAGIEHRHLHASGHASQADLIAFLKDLDARSVIVVHSERPERMREVFPNTIAAKDGTPIIV